MTVRQAFFKIAGVFAIAAAAWFVYLPALSGGWLWDDRAEIPDNDTLRNGAGLLRLWFRPPGPDYYPVKGSIQWMLWHIWGGNPVAYHGVNLGLHALGALLFWAVLQKIFTRGSTAHPERSRRGDGEEPFDSAQGDPCGFAAWIGGMIFAVHPLAVESVAWIAELKNTLSLPLLLLAMIFWMRWSELPPTRSFDSEKEKTRTAFPMERIRGNPLHLQSPNANKARPGRHAPPLLCYGCALLFFLAAMLSKSSVVMFPAVLLLHAWWRRGRVGRRDLVATAPFFAVSLALGMVTYWFQIHRAIGAADIPLGGVMIRAGRAVMGVVFYVWKFLFPFNLGPIYPAWPIGPAAVWECLSLLLFAGVVVWIWIGKRGSVSTGKRPRFAGPLPDATWTSRLPSRRPAAGSEGRSGDARLGRNLVFGLGAYVLFLLPALGIVSMSYLRLSSVADHFAYLPMLGLIGLATAGIGEIANAISSERGTGFQPVLDENMGWKPMLLFCCIAALLAALALTARRHARHFQSEEKLWTYAEVENPDSPLAADYLGIALAADGRLPEGIFWFQKAIRLAPGFASGHNDLGLALTENGRTLEAIPQYEEAVRIKPDFALAWHNLGLALTTAGRPLDAENAFRQALRIQPDFSDAHDHLGFVLMRENRAPEAIAEYREAIRIRPDDAEARNNLGSALLDGGDVPAAIAQYEAALRLKPDYPGAENNLGYALAQGGHGAEAIGHYQSALRLNPDFAEAANNLGNAFLTAGRLPDAIAEYRRAVQLKPDLVTAHNNLGVALQKSGQVWEAVTAYDDAINLNPGDARSHVNLGVALANLGLYAKAEAQFSLASAIDPGLSESYFQMGEVLAKIGKPADAILEYQKALKIKPDYGAAQKRLDRLESDKMTHRESSRS